MNAILVIFVIWCLSGLVCFFWGIYKAPTIEDECNYQDWLLKNEPKDLGQGLWIKE